MADFLDSSPLKPDGQKNRHLVGSIYGQSSVTIAPSHQISAHFGQVDSEKKIFRNLKQELPVVAMFVKGSGLNEQAL
jgi:hypothetical protein